MRRGRSGPRRRWNIEMLVDTNIFLEVELAQEHAEASKNFLAMVRDGSIRAATTDFHVDSIVLVMENYGKSWKDLAVFLASLFLYKGLVIHPIGMGGRLRAVHLMRDYGIDFDDALALQALRDLSIRTLVSYGRDFNRGFPCDPPLCIPLSAEEGSREKGLYLAPSQ
ncbi:MAG: type II toxin-antitoxin system VapC family toxin [Candidatus Korarchaeota archaeon]|nr:type II toxin-antitoxin system VapC family toxin [Candidatus Korarchaeota archaeon]